MMVACLSTFFDCSLHLHGKSLSCLPTFMLQGRSKLFHGGVAQVYIHIPHIVSGEWKYTSLDPQSTERTPVVVVVDMMVHVD